jgi:hypothetical protein
MSDIELINAFALYQNKKSGGNAVLSSDVNNLQGGITDLKGQLSILDAQEETYNEMYINAKENPTNFSLFSKLGLRTTQDWVFGYFYFSYILFSVLLILSFVKESQQKIFGGLFMLGTTFVVGVLITTALVAYA